MGLNAEYIAEGADKKAKIFEKSQHCKIDNYRKYQREPDQSPVLLSLITVYCKSREIIKQNAEYHQQHIYGFSPSIKNKTTQKKNVVLDLHWYYVIQYQCDRQKYK